MYSPQVAPCLKLDSSASEGYWERFRQSYQHGPEQKYKLNIGKTKPTYLKMLLYVTFWCSGDIKRAMSDLGNDVLVSSSGDGISEGLNNTTGTFEKCSVGILIYV